MFASRKKKVLEFTDEDNRPIHVYIHQLSHASLEKAAEARQITIGQTVSRLGPDLLNMFKGGGTTPDAAAAADAKERAYQSYDRGTVLRQGVSSWDALDEKGQPVPLHTGLDDLDSKTAEAIYRAIIDLSVEEAETRKNA